MESKPTTLLAAFCIEPVPDLEQDNILKDAKDLGLNTVVISHLPAETSEKLLSAVDFFPKHVLSSQPPEDFAEELESTLIIRESFP